MTRFNVDKIGSKQLPGELRSITEDDFFKWISRNENEPVLQETRMERINMALFALREGILKETRKYYKLDEQISAESESMDVDQVQRNCGRIVTDPDAIEHNYLKEADDQRNPPSEFHKATQLLQSFCTKHSSDKAGPILVTDVRITAARLTMYGHHFIRSPMWNYSFLSELKSEHGGVCVRRLLYILLTEIVRLLWNPFR